MSDLVLKSKENRQQKSPTATVPSSTIPRRSVCLASTTSNAAKTSKSIPILRRSVPNVTVNKTPDLLHPPKFGGQQWVNRKPDITNNLPNKNVQKPAVQRVAEKPKLDFQLFFTYILDL